MFIMNTLSGKFKSLYVIESCQLFKSHYSR